jgi:hypothetical protein
MATDPFHIDRRAWNALEQEQRRLLSTAGMSIEEKLRRGQHLSAQAAALRRAIVHDEPSARRS